MPTVPTTLAERCRGVQLLVLDVDGVLTEGGIVYGTGGLEVKHFHVRDGSGLKLWKLAGRRSAFITGRSSPMVDGRAAELGVDFVFQGASDKLPAYKRLLENRGIASFGGRLCRRRPAGPAADAPVRVGRDGRRRLPRGAIRGPLRHPRRGRPGGRAGSDRVDPALPGRMGPAGGALAIRSSENDGKGPGHVDPQADCAAGVRRRPFLRRLSGLFHLPRRHRRPAAAARRRYAATLSSSSAPEIPRCARPETR